MKQKHRDEDNINHTDHDNNHKFRNSLYLDSIRFEIGIGIENAIDIEKLILSWGNRD
jgi:hypothetical protein